MNRYALSPALAFAVALAVSGTPATAQSQSQTATDPAPYSQELRRLMDAADTLREAAQTAAAEAEGGRRTEAIREVNDALLDAQQAMVSLPVEAMTTKDPAIDDTVTMDKLQQAAQRLRDATHAIAEEEAGPGRNQAIKAANAALAETQQAMIDLLPEVASN